jgi:hypothetical protein
VITNVERRNRFPVFLAIVFLAFHLPYLPASLEDLDSINFALGIGRFDVTQHQPHPPGYPLFILLAKATHTVIPSEAKALAALSIAAGTLGVLAIAALFRRVDGQASTSWWIAATALTMTSPLYWFTAARPLSDSTGLAATVAVLAMTLAATTAGALVGASFCAGFAAGIRSQVVWLTVPMLAYSVARAARKASPPGLRSPEIHASFGQTRRSAGGAKAVGPGLLLKTMLAYVAGVLMWAVPLVILTGGPAAYWRALFNQGTEDLTGIRMLWTAPTVRNLVDALYYAFVAPWAAWPIATVVLVFALPGAAALLRRDRRAFLILAVAFGPYLVFDLLFQEAFTGRYALPLVIPIAYLAVAGARLLPRESGLALVAALAIVSAHVSGTSVAAYSRQKAPAFRLLEDMRATARAAPNAPVLAMDRREEFDLRRPIRWIGDAMPPLGARLPSPPQHEWLELAKYWNEGRNLPVWFVADPLRTDIELVDHPDAAQYRWSLPYPVLMSGVRPNEMDWYQLDRPEWYLERGWSLTPEVAGITAREPNHPTGGGLSLGALGGTLMIGGRNIAGPPATVTLTIEGSTPIVVPAPPGPFLSFVQLPDAIPWPADPGGPGGYIPFTVQSTAGSQVMLEQFDASKRQVLSGFGNGWHEQEYNAQTGLRWRWLSERGELRLRSPVPNVRLRLAGESPRKYFSRASHLVVRSAGTAVFDGTLPSDFSLDITIPNVTDVITLETDQIFVPGDRSSRTGDRRHLGLRIFKCELRSIP